MFSSLYREKPLLAASGQAGRQLQLASCTLVGGQLLAGLDHTSQASCFYMVSPCCRLLSNSYKDSKKTKHGRIWVFATTKYGRLRPFGSSVQLLAGHSGQPQLLLTKQLLQY